MRGANVIRIRSKEDLSEMWSEIQKSKNTTSLWCDGLIEVNSKKTSRKRKLISDDEESDDYSSCKSKPKKKRQETDEKVQEIVETLKKWYGAKYTFMQVRIWAELIVSGVWMNLPIIILCLRELEPEVKLQKWIKWTVLLLEWLLKQHQQ